MAAHTSERQAQQDGGITPSELQAELDTLRSLRRRSISQPSDGIDPDLPPSPSKYSHAGSSSIRDGSPPISPTSPSFSSSSLGSGYSSSDAAPVAGPSTGVSRGMGVGMGGFPRFPHTTLDDESDEHENDDVALAGPGSFGDGDLSDLFWLPARLHPEIAPQEFRNFIKDQTKPENLMRRSGSTLGRKKSMLSRQYNPTDSDLDSGSDNDNIKRSSSARAPSRTGSFRRSTGLERLTLNDLQQLEALARQAAEEGQQGQEGEAKLKHLVRRSLSLNPAALLGAASGEQPPFLASETDDSRPYVDDTDSPLIVPPPGSIIRRSARTKIRKNSLLGDGDGHRFGRSRRSIRASPLGETGDTEDIDEEGDRSRESRKVSTGSQMSMLTSEEPDDRASPMKDQQETELWPRRAGSISPEKLQHSSVHTQEPLPMQYMSPTPPVAVSPSDGNRLSGHHVTPARSDADLPHLSRSASPPDVRNVPISPTNNGEAPPSPSPPAMQGSLRTTRKPGQPSVQPGQLSSTRPVQHPSVTPFPSQEPEASTPSPSQSIPVTTLAPNVKVQDEQKPALPRKTSADAVRSRVVNPQPASAPQQLPANTYPLAQQPSVTPPPPHQPLLQTHVHPQAKSSPAVLPGVDQLRPGDQSVGPSQPPTHVMPSQPAHRQQQSPSTAPAQAAPPKEKEKKSGWARLGLSRSGKDDSSDADDTASIHSVSSTASGKEKKGKKSKKGKEAPAAVEKRSQHASQAALNEKEKEKAESTGGFFGGLFGSKKKPEHSDGDAQSRHGRTDLSALAMPTPPPTASGMLTSDGIYVNFYRLPIHIERAVYRLSHIKLANPRRPLYEQVLISNLMFWYLGVINKPPMPPPTPQTQQQQQQRPLDHRPQNHNGASVINEGFANPTGPNAYQHQPQPITGRPGLKREASTPPPPPPAAEFRQRANSDLEDRPLQEHLDRHAQSRPTDTQRPVSHPPAAFSPPAATRQSEHAFRDQDLHTTESTAGREGTAYGSAATKGQPVFSIPPSPMNGGDAYPMPVSRRSPTEAGFQVMRPQRSGSMQSGQAPALDNPGSEQPSLSVTTSGISMNFKSTGETVEATSPSSSRRLSDFETLDIISAYADEERRRSLLMTNSPTETSPVSQYGASGPSGSDFLTSSSIPTSRSASPSTKAPPPHQHATLLGSAPRSSPPATTSTSRSRSPQTLPAQS